MGARAGSWNCASSAASPSPKPRTCWACHPSRSRATGISPGHGLRERCVAPMTPDRWQTIERLYHATLERSPSERDAFLAAACQGDETLRTEVESLIAHGLDAPAILDAQPGRELRAALTRRFDEQPSVAGRYRGQMFGPYAVQALLAAGG